MKKIWKPKRFIVSLSKTIYIMNPLELLVVAFIEDVTNLQTVCTYFLIGVIVAALLEKAIENAGYPMEWSDRFWVVLGWPLASAIFIYSFIKGFFSND